MFTFSFFFDIKDKYRNQTGHDVTGKVLLELLSGAPGVSEVPCFVGNTRKLHLSLNRGKAAFSVSRKKSSLHIICLI